MKGPILLFTNSVCKLQKDITPLSHLSVRQEAESWEGLGDQSYILHPSCTKTHADGLVSVKVQ